MKAEPLTFYLPDTRGVLLSPFGLGNRKIGAGVYTYSRVAGRRGIPDEQDVQKIYQAAAGTCPGSTPECEAICYAKRIAAEQNVVNDVHLRNSFSDNVPELPEDCQLLRIHVSGDFNTERYIRSWIRRLTERPDVRAWAYTRSWRVPELLPALQDLHALPNLQLFASMDPSCTDEPPAGWRRAWIHRSGDHSIATGRPMEDRIKDVGREHDWSGFENRYDFMGSPSFAVYADGTPAYVCPEETGAKPDCVACGYCLRGKRHDVVFLEH